MGVNAKGRYKTIRRAIHIFLSVVVILFLPVLLVFRAVLKLILKEPTIIFLEDAGFSFRDNYKYLYLYLLRAEDPIFKKARMIFLSRTGETYDMLRRRELPTVKLISLRGAYWLLLADVMILISTTISRISPIYYLTLLTKKVQLWHGIGFKEVELRNRKFSALKKFYISIIYDALVSTSEFFTENFFRGAFKYREIWETGYPRNDIFFRELYPEELINVQLDIYEEFVGESEYKVIIYAPTFRDTGGDPISDGILNLKRLDEFLGEVKAKMIVKLHHATPSELSHLRLSNIKFYPNKADIYPLLKHSHLLITDYSSICMDYLLLDKPIIFFPYDIDKYQSDDRAFAIDYWAFTPGPKVYTQEQLEEAIREVLVKEEDNWRGERQRVLKLAFKYRDGRASARIAERLKELLR